MPATLHGIRASTYDNMLFGPGIARYNLDLSILLDPAHLDRGNASVAQAKSVGATRGGLSFAVEPEMRMIEVDGQRGALMGAERKDSEEATLTVNFVELTALNILRSIPGAKAEKFNDNFIHITGGDLTLQSYIRNIGITAIHGVGGRLFPTFIVIENALAMEGLEIALEDKDEAAPEVSFKAHYNPATPDTSPWHILMHGTQEELEDAGLTVITP